MRVSRKVLDGLNAFSLRQDEAMAQFGKIEPFDLRIAKTKQRMVEVETVNVEVDRNLRHCAPQ